jgi:excisionase family DNA binding protein
MVEVPEVDGCRNSSRDEEVKRVIVPAGWQILPQWLTVKEVAEYLSVSPGTVHNWCSAKYIPHVKRGHVLRFSREAIDSWLSTGRCNGRTSLKCDA